MAHASLVRRFSSPTPDTITIEPGTPADLAPFARFHYAAGRPGPIALVHDRSAS